MQFLHLISIVASLNSPLKRSFLQDSHLYSLSIFLEYSRRKRKLNLDFFDKVFYNINIMFKKYILILFLFLVLPFFDVSAETYIKKFDNNGNFSGYVYIPDNAYLNFNGDGYYCSPGYVDKGGYCEKIKIPKNGIFVEKFNSWVCASGYIKQGDSCEKIKVPDNASLSGNDFVCNPGYIREGDSCKKQISSLVYFNQGECPYGYQKKGYSCIQLFIDSNARFTSDGHDFVCNYGYFKTETGCVKVNVPANAYLTENGTSWTCNYGYKNMGNYCLKVSLPSNAYFVNSTGTEWDCLYGYLKKNNKCEKIYLPPNAHFDSSYKYWLCDYGYKSNGKYCEKMNISNGYINKYNQVVCNVYYYYNGKDCVFQK